MQADALQFDRAFTNAWRLFQVRRCLRVWGVLLSDLVSERRRSSARWLRVQARGFWFESFVVVLAPTGAVPNERSLLARGVLSHCAARAIAVPLCVASIAHLEMCVSFTGHIFSCSE